MSVSCNNIAWITTVISPDGEKEKAGQILILFFSLNNILIYRSLDITLGIPQLKTTKHCPLLFINYLRKKAKKHKRKCKQPRLLGSLHEWLSVEISPLRHCLLLLSFLKSKFKV